MILDPTRPYHKFLISVLLNAILMSPVYALEPIAPFSYRDIYTYGSSTEFEPTIKVIEHCSGSRVSLSDNDPFDYYISAAHCFQLNQTSKNDIEEEIYYVKHPKFYTKDYEDIALCTNKIKSNLPRYEIIYPQENEILGKSFVIVGYGSNESDLKDYNFLLEKLRQAANTKISYSNNQGRGFFVSNSIISDRTSLQAFLTGGDSGGSLLIKDNLEYKLAGIISSTGLYSYQDMADIYSLIPTNEITKGNHQQCVYSNYQEDKCYGSISLFSKIDKNFIAQAKELLEDPHLIPLYINAFFKDNYEDPLFLPVVLFNIRLGLAVETTGPQNNCHGYIKPGLSTINILLNEISLLNETIQEDLNIERCIHIITEDEPDKNEDEEGFSFKLKLHKAFCELGPCYKLDIECDLKFCEKTTSISEIKPFNIISVPISISQYNKKTLENQPNTTYPVYFQLIHDHPKDIIELKIIDSENNYEHASLLPMENFLGYASKTSSYAIYLDSIELIKAPITDSIYYNAIKGNKGYWIKTTPNILKDKIIVAVEVFEGIPK